MERKHTKIIQGFEEAAEKKQETGAKKLKKAFSDLDFRTKTRKKGSSPAKAAKRFYKSDLGGVL